MADNQLPKATMSNFIKERVKDKKKISAEFTTVMLDLSKGTSPAHSEFIDKISAHANDICEKQGKKTINNEHLFKCLEEFGMAGFIPSLQELDESLKAKHQKKMEVKKQVQERIDKINQEQEEKEGQSPACILLEDKKNKKIDLEDEEEDFREYLDVDEDEE